jgi:hypothetical protein
MNTFQVTQIKFDNKYPLKNFRKYDTVEHNTIETTALNIESNMHITSNNLLQ